MCRTLESSPEQWSRRAGEARIVHLHEVRTITPSAVDMSSSIDEQQFQEAFGESLASTLDLQTWETGSDLGELYGRLEREVEEALRQENRVIEQVRATVFPRLRDRPGAPPGAGVYQTRVARIEELHRFLFSGQVEACDGTSVVHDTLPITIAQIGVCLVSYHGDQGAWVHRLFRRDLRMGSTDPVNEALELLERRRERSGSDERQGRDRLSELARRGIMTYAERAVLLHRATAPWRMGHGSPAPYELLTGSGMVRLLDASLDLLTELVLRHQRFVFVPSESRDRMLRTIGNALRPLEYAIIETQQTSIERLLTGHYTGEWAQRRPRLQQFAQEVGSRIVVGVYRASALAPAQVFYAHVEHAHTAAQIAIADSTLHEHRGFPMLIDLADLICRGTFDPGALSGLTQSVYVQAGEPFRYLAERKTR